ncbi:STAS domain-containing protein [Methylomonas sp. EFPC3]|uniref:STAS domain-containing protein n=1 Tax=Methylomonas sp. EFPC3 TaxID=3021710 RepID=UPI0024161A10|nr:STAS domain-containing protein [Methylomonas sp. EFPC3]WFP51596.1 STAS domain-containing protein [Methylomonas sp. EFPC3]
MAENGENSLIGYDPLAWMRTLGPEEQAAEAMPAAVPADGEDAVTSVTEATDTIVSDTASTDELSESVPQTSAKGSLALEPLLNIQGVADLHQNLMQMLSRYDAIDIDASAVASIDTSTLQLLVILKRTAAGLQKVVAIDFPSDKFIEAAELLGVSEMLEVDTAASGFF